MELITSRLIGVPHGFPTREGGVSAGPFASLNAAVTVGDSPEAVEENLRRLAREAKVEATALLTVSQVHGDAVIEAVAEGAGLCARNGGLVAWPRPIAEADALWTAAERVAVGVKTADCLPILVEDPVGRRVAAVHAGWRGVMSTILARTVAHLVAHGSRPEELRIAVGPAIQRCCFEVDVELAERFAARFGDDVVVRGHAKPHLDLPLAVRRTAQESGVPASHVDVLPHCTFCDGQRRFFSHRRDQGRTGRHLSFISCVFDTRM